MKTGVERSCRNVVLFIFFEFFLTSCASVANAGSVNPCWADGPNEVELVKAAEIALAGKLNTVNYWPRMPVDTSSERGFVECVKIKFQKNHDRYRFETIASTRDTLTPASLKRAKEMDKYNLEISEGVLIFYYFNPLVESHWVEFDKLKK